MLIQGGQGIGSFSIEPNQKFLFVPYWILRTDKNKTKKNMEPEPKFLV